MIDSKILGLVAATHTPFSEDGLLNLPIVEKQAAHLLEHRVELAFIGGTTGEWSSLTLEERRALSARWIDVARGSRLKVIVHVGANCIEDARSLAQQSQELGAWAISALSPSFFKPASAQMLAETMGAIADAAPGTPFYYYEIPSMTGVTVSPSLFLGHAVQRIPNLAGLKFTSMNLIEYQTCLAFHEGRFDIAFGVDEMLLAALSLGAVGAVGSTYNFAAPIYHRLLRAFNAGDLRAARTEQYRSVQLVALLARHGYMGAAKAVMAMLDVDVGAPRLPNARLTPAQQEQLRQELIHLGFFDWIKGA